MRMCSGNWIDTYLKYVHDQESPVEFHRWVALTVIGTALGRKVLIPRIKYKIFPNLYVILVAGSAMCRKSSALQIGRDLLKNSAEPPTIFAQKLTTEALIQTMHETYQTTKNSTGVIFASELSVFLGSDGIRSGIIPALTELYDSPDDWTYQTRSRGRESMQNVFLTLLGASTKSWLRTSIPQDAIGGGFTSRVLFVCENAPSKLTLFENLSNLPETQKLRSMLINDINHISQLKGTVQFTGEAIKISEEWYKNEAFQMRDEKTEGYFGRKHDTMFKLATIISTMENDSLIIEAHHIKAALQLLAHNERNLLDVLETVGSSSFGGVTDKVLGIIKRFKEIDRSSLLKKCWRFANATEMNDIMKILLESGELEQYTDAKNKLWYKVKR
jgi:hypothetical protein